MFRLTASHLVRLGVAHPRVEELLQDMHWKVLKRLEQTVGTWRRLEHEGKDSKTQGRNTAKRKRGT